MFGVGMAEFIIIGIIGAPMVAVAVLLLVVLASRRNSRHQSPPEELKLLRELAGQMEGIEQRLNALESEVRGKR